MNKIDFRCLNCGARVEKDLLPGKHTVLGALPVINKEACCCEDPEYEDTIGHHRSMVEKSFMDVVPGLRA